MYPTDELTALQREKLLCVERSAELRGEITSACDTLAYPVTIAEGLIVKLKRFTPYFSVLSSFLIKPAPSATEGLRGRPGLASAVLKWAPTIFRAIKIFRSSRQST